MADLLGLGIWLGGGALLGLAFFGSLRWTLARLPASRRPGLTLAASLAARWALLAGALVAVVRLGGWPAAAATTAGLLAARWFLAWPVLAAGGRRAEG